MTMEALLIIFVFATVVLSAFAKPSGTFFNYAPRLGARIENHLAVGQSFKVRSNDGGTDASLRWEPQNRPAPDGSFR